MQILNQQLRRSSPCSLPTLLLLHCLYKRPSAGCQFLPHSLFAFHPSLLCVCVCTYVSALPSERHTTDGELKSHEPYCDRRDSLLLSPELMALMAPSHSTDQTRGWPPYPRSVLGCEVSLSQISATTRIQWP